MIGVLAESPLLTQFVTVALGTLVGAIPFGPVKFGAAGALFVGLASGASFFRDLKKQTPLMVLGVVLLVVFSGLTILAATLFALGGPTSAGLMASALTSTPALAAATSAADGSPDPAVAYSIAYPIGVVVTMLIVTVVAKTPLPARRDPNPPGSLGLNAITVRVDRSVRVSDIPGIASIPGKDTGEVRVSYLHRVRWGR